VRLESGVSPGKNGKLPRIPVRRRGGSPEIKEEGDQSWAVSYADLLMVLLSFFILFFSVDDGKRSEVIMKVADSARGLAGKPVGAGGESASSSEGHASLADLKTAFAGAPRIESKSLGDKLLVYLPDGIFDAGRTVLNPEGERVVLDTLKRIKPHSDSFVLTFVGHSDDVRIKKSFTRYLKDNVDLSAVRASRGLAMAKKAGFDAERVFIKGTGNHVRNSRTLTLVIEPLGSEGVL
jgi:flagellar motor protein MotB